MSQGWGQGGLGSLLGHQLGNLRSWRNPIVFQSDPINTKWRQNIEEAYHVSSEPHSFPGML